ncbi:hypothetical protein ACK3TF_000269 [Chlorella vulgaris]
MQAVLAWVSCDTLHVLEAGPNAVPYQDLAQLPDGSLTEGFTALLTADATTAYEREMEVARLREKVCTVEAENLHLKANEAYVLVAFREFTASMAVPLGSVAGPTQGQAVAIVPMLGTLITAS